MKDNKSLTEATQSKGIEWNDPSVLRYHDLKNKSVSIAQAIRNMITYLKNQGGYKETYFKRMSYNDIRPIFERTVEEEKVEKEDVKPDPVMIERSCWNKKKNTCKKEGSRRIKEMTMKVLYKLVQERFKDHSLEEKELILWGDLRMMFDPDEQDEIWKNQESWKVLRWRLYENSGVHSVFLTDTPMEINMLVEKNYPLK
ncbi:hypothetical protein Tco_0981400 [Tanacetum coccineum]